MYHKSYAFIFQGATSTDALKLINSVTHNLTHYEQTYAGKIVAKIDIWNRT